MTSVMLRLPDGTLKTVEEYIVSIIQDASSQIVRDQQLNGVTCTGEGGEPKGDDSSPAQTQDDSAAATGTGRWLFVLHNIYTEIIYPSHFITFDLVSFIDLDEMCL